MVLQSKTVIKQCVASSVVNVSKDCVSPRAACTVCVRVMRGRHEPLGGVGVRIMALHTDQCFKVETTYVTVVCLSTMGAAHRVVLSVPIMSKCHNNTS